MKRSLILTALSFLVLAQLAWAQVPQTMSYQGVLRDDSGNIVPNGTYYATFSIYDVVTATTPVWTSGLLGVGVTDGVFSVILGPMPEPFPSPAWLGIRVDPDPNEMTPRIELTAVPYSLQAGSVSGADNVLPSSGNVGIGTATPSQKLDVNGTVLANGFALNNPNTKISSLTTDNIDLITSNAVRVRIDPSGSVGIGTTSPSAKLDVKGIVKADTLQLATAAERWYSIPAPEFRPGGTYSHVNLITYVYSQSGGSNVAFFAPVHLPHGATITEFETTVGDTTSGNMTVQLTRVFSDGTAYTVSSLSSPSIGVNTIVSGPLSDTVDNKNNVYMVRAAWKVPGWGPTYYPEDVNIRGARVKYTVNTPLP